MTDGALALVAHTTLDVADSDVQRRTAQMLKYRGGLFPQEMTEAQAAALARLSLLYRLDPLAQELTLFQGHPYLTLQGALRIANDHPKFRGLSCEPATDVERGAFRCREDEDLWVARVYRSDRDVPTVGYGRASRTDDQPVARRWTQEQAQARAKRRALRDAFSLPLPGGEDAPTVDVVTGEIVEPLYSTPMISPEQTRAIHAIARSSGYDTWHYRDALRRMFGVDSSQELTQAQAQAAIEAFAAEAAAPTAEERVAERRGGEEEEFYVRLEAAADASGSAEPRFFQPVATGSHDELAEAQTAYSELLLEARGRGVSADEFVELDGSESLRQVQAATELLRERVTGS